MLGEFVGIWLNFGVCISVLCDSSRDSDSSPFFDDSDSSPFFFYFDSDSDSDSEIVTRSGVDPFFGWGAKVRKISKFFCALRAQKSQSENENCVCLVVFLYKI